MGILKVELLGSVRVTHNNWLNEAKLTREIQALLAYLLLQRHRPHSREILAEVFWGEYNHKKSHRALNTALWRLKHALEPDGISPGTYLISAHSGEVGFNCDSRYWLDVEVFEQQANHLLTCPPQKVGKSNILELEKILDLYKGELLEDLYDNWAVREREHLRTIYLQCLTYIMQYYKLHKAYEKSSAYGQQILNLDPIREDIHREMMNIYLESGQRALAARQYGICQLTLIKELGISPMEETQMLYRQIFPESHKNHIPLASEESLNLEQALGELRQISHTIELAREQIQQTLQYFTRHTSSGE